GRRDHNVVALDCQQIGKKLYVLRRVVDDKYFGWRIHLGNSVRGEEQRVRCSAPPSPAFLDLSNFIRRLCVFPRTLFFRSPNSSLLTTYYLSPPASPAFLDLSNFIRRLCVFPRPLFFRSPNPSLMTTCYLAPPANTRCTS